MILEKKSWSFKTAPVFRRDIDEISRSAGWDLLLLLTDTKGNIYIIVVGTADVMVSDNSCFNKYDSMTLVTQCGISTPQEDRVCVNVLRPSP